MAPDRQISAGTPIPLGPDVQKNGVNFALFSAHATAVTLCLFSKDGITETERIELAKTDDVWHIFVKGLKTGQLYGYRVDGPYEAQKGHRFNANKLLIDPYAKSLFGAFIQHDALYGYDVNAPEKDLSFSTSDSAPYIPKSVVGEPNYNWEKDKHPQTRWADTIIYEAHVKGFTKRLESLPVTHRGTLSGLSHPKTLNYLKDLGITAIELLPLQSFFSEPRLTDMGLTNYWGYNPVNYFAPHAPYLGPTGEVTIQDTVKALHKAGIEVILDVVYNHTAESWELGPTLSYRGIDNASYYHLSENPRYYVNHTGCGNTLNMTHPKVLELTLDSLRYWVETMHVDGFRFDLAPTLARNPHEFDAHAPFFAALKADPVFSNVKLIAEPWDIGPGGYVLGQFPKAWGEWNDCYRDDIRSFWRGDAGAHQRLAGGLLGSASHFDSDGRPPTRSVNFISAHDGFTLDDTVSFSDKHNYANGEDNRDGHGHNLSDNMGFEGKTDNEHIMAARHQRKKNMLATLLLSQGTPMLLAGDEFGHTQNGNNNAYCQDNETTWLDWENRDKSLQDFTRKLIKLRKTNPHFTQIDFLHGETLPDSYVRNVEWVSPSGHSLQTHEWENPHLKCFALALSMPSEDTMLIIYNRGAACEFELPSSNVELLLSTSNNVADISIIPANSVSILKVSGHCLTKDRRGDVLSDMSHKFGVSGAYRDINGTAHSTPETTREKLLTALGVDLNSFKILEPPTKFAPSNSKVYGAKQLRTHGGCWGVTVAVYGLKSDRNWGMGDFEDLAVLAEIMGKKGADFIGINPVHALFPSAPDLFAPYSPSSRRFLNVMSIAPDKIPDLPQDLEFNIQALQACKYVDYTAVYTAKMQAFEVAFSVFSRLPKTSKRRKLFEAFQTQNGPALQTHALFDALFETLPAKKRTYDGWKNFAKKYAEPTSKACRKFAEDHKDRITFYAYLQWVAHTQLSSAQTRAKAAGMSIGLYLDFAVGIVPGGSDAWQNKDAFAKNISLGAPGDMANPDGQIWNLLPFNPHELINNDFEPYRSHIAHAMSLGGALRIDHILGHSRSFWIPTDGGHGAYVEYPFDGLLQMIAEESQSALCTIFGEDLGTVPDGFRDRMAGYDLMGCNIALIERGENGHLIPSQDIRSLSITGFSNHDFPTLSGFWNSEDFKWREDLGIGDDPKTLRHEKQRRQHDKDTLLWLSGYQTDSPSVMTPDLMTKLQAYLAGSKALAFAMQLDDLMLEPLQANIPGTTDEQPNWRRRSRLSLEEIAQDKDVATICRAVQNARKGT